MLAGFGRGGRVLSGQQPSGDDQYQFGVRAASVAPGVFRIWPGLTVAVLLTVFVLGRSSPSRWATCVRRRPGATCTGTSSVQGNRLQPARCLRVQPRGRGRSTARADASRRRSTIVLLASSRSMDTSRIKFEQPGRHRLGRAARLLPAQGLATGTLEDSAGRLYFMFCTGSALYLLRDGVRLSCAGPGGVRATALSAGHGWRSGSSTAATTPPTRCSARRESLSAQGPILRFNRLGDYSYGTYIYAYPVQQSFVRLFPDLTTMQLFAGSLAVTLAIAVISWHVIEKPALGLVRRRPAPLPPEADWRDAAKALQGKPRSTGALGPLRTPSRTSSVRRPSDRRARPAA